MENKFFNKIKQEKILDVYVCGLVDIENGIAEFIPMTDDIYFKFDTTIIRFESVEQYSKLKIQYVNQFTYKFEDEDMYPANSSIGKIVLTNIMADMMVKSIEIYGAEQTDNELICHAASFLLNTGQEIFIDPGFCDGIGVGGQHQKDTWLRNYPNTDSYTVPKLTVELTAPQLNMNG